LVENQLLSRNRLSRWTMKSLSLSLLGPFQLLLHQHPITHFPSNKAKALLVYLAMTIVDHPGAAVPREALMELLWPGMPLASAQANLRTTLYRLNKTVPDIKPSDSSRSVPFVLSERQVVRIHPQAEYGLDIADFYDLARKQDSAPALINAAGLYRGPFLSDFFLPDSAEFETWAATTRERLRQEVLQVLEWLVAIFVAASDWQQAEIYSRRQLEVDGLQERAHRQLMAILAYNGRRSEALRQYQVCRDSLCNELGVEPSAETVALYETIRSGDFSPESSLLPLSNFTNALARPDLPLLPKAAPAERAAAFVGRERPLASLEAHLESTLQGRGQLALITGSAGEGKTSLMIEFARRAQNAHPDLIVAAGNCSAYAGVGDPYQPFLEILDHLIGVRRAALATLPALLEHAPAMVGNFVSLKSLQARANAIPGSQGRKLVEALRLQIEQPDLAGVVNEPAALFEQFTRFLRAVAAQRPLLLALDDLQWVDEASLGLLFHLTRRLEGARLLLVCAYRPEEVSLGRDDERHPLSKFLAEAKLLFGDVWIDIAADRRQTARLLVDRLLDREGNQLGEDFRRELLGRTMGHPLFTVELLRVLRERGSLVQDEKGRWIVNRQVDWDSLPARVEGVIEERIANLNPEQHLILSVASVVGETFTLEVIAQVVGLYEGELLQQMERELARRHRLVREMDVSEGGEAGLTHYSFEHVLFQHYLYQQLGSGEKRYYHRAVGQALEKIYAGRDEEILPQLAYHFVEARQSDKAAAYLRRAAERSQRLLAIKEALDYFYLALENTPATDIATQAEIYDQLSNCLRFNGQLSESLEVSQKAIELYGTLGDPVKASEMMRRMAISQYFLGKSDASWENANRALELLHGLEDDAAIAQNALVMATIGARCMVDNQFDRAATLSERALVLVEQTGAEQAHVIAGHTLGICRAAQGQVEAGLVLLRQALDRAIRLSLYGESSTIYNNLTYWYWKTGQIRLAIETCTAYEQFAVRSASPAEIHNALNLRIFLEWNGGNWRSALERRHQFLVLYRQNRDSAFHNLGFNHNLAMIDYQLGDLAGARTALESHLEQARQINLRQQTPSHLGGLLLVYADLSLPEQTLALIDELLGWFNQTAFLEADELLFFMAACRWFSSLPAYDDLGRVGDCLRHLERGYRQLCSPLAEAYWLEGRAYAAVYRGQPGAAVQDFHHAARLWEQVSQPYDQLRALSALQGVLHMVDDASGAQAACRQACSILHTLADQIDDTHLKQTFLNSPLARQTLGCRFP
jgi:DNA-binding SARP family transcriptional activator/predicted ATPase